MAEWRTGRKVGRTIYRDEVLVGMMDTPELAQELVDAINARAAAGRAAGWFMTSDELARRERTAFANGRANGRIDAARDLQAAAARYEAEAFDP